MVGSRPYKPFPACAVSMGSVCAEGHTSTEAGRGLLAYLDPRGHSILVCHFRCHQRISRVTEKQNGVVCWYLHLLFSKEVPFPLDKDTGFSGNLTGCIKWQFFLALALHSSPHFRQLCAMKCSELT